MMNNKDTLARQVLVWLCLVTGYWLAGAVYGAFSLYTDYQNYYTQTLLPAKAQIWQDSADVGHSREADVIFTLRSAALLDQLLSENRWQVYGQCRHTERIGGQLQFGWFILSNITKLEFNLSDATAISCQLSPWPLTVASLFSAFLTLLSLRFRPRALSAHDQRVLSVLSACTQGELNYARWRSHLVRFRSQASSEAICSDYLQAALSHPFIMARTEQPEDVQVLLRQSTEPLSLVICCTEKGLQISINAIPINLSVTPAIYWLWYAQKRITEIEQGWVINPASSRPDHGKAAELIALMEKYSGHGRAISELQQHGLRAKTLDQNRNKIKEALVLALGETLADQCGFESHKHETDSQYSHRLKMSVKQIDIVDLVV